MKFSSLAASAPLVLSVLAGPFPVHVNRELDPLGNLEAILQGISAAVSQGDPTGVLAALRNVAAVTDAPTSPDEAAASLQAIFNGTATPPANLYDYIANLRALNLIDTVDSLLNFVNGVANGQDSPNNNNPPSPDIIYPQKSSCDAPYSVSETTLRSAIYIPPGFTFGKIPPVILFPGTGNYGYETFAGNFIPLLTGSDFADPVWVNVPRRLLDDAQKSAEFAAYTINYIASITKTNVTMLAWSQGNINAQWAYKYWPSTTTVTTDHIAVSGDYDGTLIANFAALPGEPLPPSLLQQEYLQSSNYITTLQTFNGDSAYVPTTTIYSGFLDEIVEPQQGVAASSYLNDARGVGANNYQVQLVCPGQPAGTFYTHEGVLYNPLPYFLLRDAMKNPGPGDIKRLDLPSVCATYLTPGLDLGDLLVTENAIAIAGLAILTYPDPVFQEPAISSYALTSSTSTCLPTSTISTTSTSTVSTTTTSVSTSLSSTSLSSSSMTTTTTKSSYSKSTSYTSVSTSYSNSWVEWSGSSSGDDTKTSVPESTASEVATWAQWSGSKSQVFSVSQTVSVTSQSWTQWPSPTKSMSAVESMSATDSIPVMKSASTIHITVTTWTSGTVTYSNTITVPAGSASKTGWTTEATESPTVVEASSESATCSQAPNVSEASVWSVWQSSTSEMVEAPTIVQSVAPSATYSAQTTNWQAWSSGSEGASNAAPAWSKATGTSLNGTSTSSGVIAQWTGAAAQNTVSSSLVLGLITGLMVLLTM